MIEAECQTHGSGENRTSFAHQSEAEFARLLDFYGVRWQYEPRTFTLREDEGRLLEAFTPDFYLPDFDLYIELTTLRQRLVAYKNRKLRQLRELYPEVKIKLLYRKDFFKLLQRFGIEPRGSKTVPAVERILINAVDLDRRVAQLGSEITHDYAGDRPVLVGVLRGVTCFMADLMRRVALPVSIDYLALSSYQADAGPLRFTKDLDESIEGRRVIIVEDIVDTGMTLNRLMHHLGESSPSDVRVCTLLDKRARRLTEVDLAYVGFAIEDEFVVGYGLDFHQEYRNLPYIATLALEEVGGRG
ncbi:MAG: hypoxanthine phosphoribosyltransferase [Dehalococcoidia bacterium]